MSIETLNKHKAVVAKALGSEDGRRLVELLRESFVDVNLLGKDDRDTVARVARHDLVIYLIEMGDLKNE